MTGTRVLITGAGGFVGSALAAGFDRLGAQVTAVDQAFDAQTRARLAGIGMVEGDLAQGDDWLGDLVDADVMIHAAALTTNPAAMGMTEADHVTANTAPLLAMLRHAGRVRPKAFVFLSSSGVFAQADGSPDLHDTDMATAQGPYSAAKKAGEVLVPGALSGVCETHVLRLGYLYGPDEAPRSTRAHVSLLQTWVNAASDGQEIVVSATNARRDWTLVTDLAPALARIVAGPGRVRPVHLCTPVSVADQDLAEAIAARFPGTRIKAGPRMAVKPPMAPSALSALDGFSWTGIGAGLDAVCRAVVTA